MRALFLLAILHAPLQAEYEAKGWWQRQVYGSKQRLASSDVREVRRDDVASFGARYSSFWMDTSLRGAPFNGLSLHEEYSAYTGGAGLAWQALPSLQLGGGAWQGFRPPNLNDSAVLKTAASGADVPAPGLRPEKSLGFELSARHEAGAFRQKGAVFHSILSDRIERVPGTFNGAAVISGAPVFRRANSSGGYIQGVEWEGRLALPRGFWTRANFSWLYGRDSATRTALSKMPPAMALAGLGWDGDYRAKPWAEAFLRLAARQRRLGVTDQTDARIDPNGTAGWSSVNLQYVF